MVEEELGGDTDEGRGISYRTAEDAGAGWDTLALRYLYFYATGRWGMRPYRHLHNMRFSLVSEEQGWIGKSRVGKGANGKQSRIIAQSARAKQMLGGVVGDVVKFRARTEEDMRKTTGNPEYSYVRP